MKRFLPPDFSTAVPLGEGGQARTWLCWQNAPGRWVVVKTDPQERGELEAEAELLERLPGAPVPALLEKDLSSPRPWIAMSWIDGIRLDALPHDLDERERLAIVAAAARSVAALHSRNVIHGDLAPANLLALPAGEVLLVDLGMASIGGARTGGTWETFSPERLQGKPASPASDVFALGVLALRLLGRLPICWTSSRTDWSRAVLDDSLRALVADIPVLARATAASPSLRPSALELAHALGENASHWPQERLRRKAHDDFDILLHTAIEQHTHQKRWSDAWRLQRERIERSDDPEPLLPELGRFARERDKLKRRNGPLLLGAFALSFILLGIAILALHPSRVASKSVSLIKAPQPEFVSWPSSPAESFPLPSIPPGASLRVDGLPTDMPDDGLLLLATGRHHIQLRDAVGMPLLDTFWIAAKPNPHRHSSTPLEKAK